MSFRSKASKENYRGDAQVQTQYTGVSPSEWGSRTVTKTVKIEFYVTVDTQSEVIHDQLAEWQHYYN